MTERKIIKIQKVTVVGVDSENAIRAEYELIMNAGPVFMRGNVQALDVSQLPPRYHRVIITHDSITDIYDSYAKQGAINPVIPSFSITFDLAGGGTELWTFENSKSYVELHDAIRIEGQIVRRPGVYTFVCVGDYTISHP